MLTLPPFVNSVCSRLGFTPGHPRPAAATPGGPPRIGGRACRRSSHTPVDPPPDRYSRNIRSVRRQTSGNPLACGPRGRSAAGDWIGRLVTNSSGGRGKSRTIFRVSTDKLGHEPARPPRPFLATHAIASEYSGRSRRPPGSSRSDFRSRPPPPPLSSDRR